MKSSVPPQTPPEESLTTSAPRKSGMRSRGSRIPIDRMLPGSVVIELQRAARSAAESTPSLAARLDQELKVTEQYGVSRRRLQNYLKRCRAARSEGLPDRTDDKQQASDTRDRTEQPVADHRRRQESVAAILDQTFGQSAKCKPELWDRRAYLMLVGLVYEKLATNEYGIETDELVALAKVLAENRRVEARLVGEQSSTSGDAHRQPTSQRLPENFADIVRQVYGTNFHDPRDSVEK